ncbi:MAG: hypothetical protein ACOCWA_09875 [Bacteroidota bacterium]
MNTIPIKAVELNIILKEDCNGGNSGAGIPSSDLVKGGELRLQMCPGPNKKWGKGEETCLPP